ncbi:MAG: N(4)-(beta-N-acetylglucosaminyl)-L-asparaginase [Tunicatimonas sp.]
MPANRRSFLRQSALFLPLSRLNLGPGFHRPSRQPLVVSTWDSGQIANGAAWPVLARGGTALDAVEQAGIAIEDDLSCCVGLGANPDRDGHVTLDACIMDERANCGAVAFLERIKHPVSVARRVMEQTPHVMLVGAGAQQFALQNGFALEPDELSPTAQQAYQDWLKEARYEPVINVENQPAPSSNNGPAAPNKLKDGSFNHDTMGTIALDTQGNVSGMCTTSGMGFKMRGRVGDSPIIGAGLYVDNEAGAAVATGQGEEVIRFCGTHLVTEYLRDGLTPQQACEKAVGRIVQRDRQRAKDFQVAFIAINKAGEVGAFAVQPGFNYTVSHGEEQGKIVKSGSYFG